jgi:Icc-related predicted phosphoesterase
MFLSRINLPYGILDGGDYHDKPYHYGNKELLNNIIDVKPKIHLFGHDHNEYGISKQNGIIFSNASLLDDQYNLCRDPQVIEL